ncbi:MAG: TIR domain-containing protein, partial [Lachnospiraceae bacterium]|nr:TIR domain-containing protein [Lachnospiraceae bacterium]
MATLRCKKCGGDLNIIDPENSICECEYCGSMETIPTIDDEKIMKLYDRANRLRIANEFDKAAGVYESIVNESDTEAEAYWGLVLCKYGIEYVDDPATGEKIPTCHRSSFDSVMEDSDFEMVMENADMVSRNVYRDNAKQIEEIRKGIIEVSGKEAPYDIFICYKETDDNGDRTIDSVMAQNVYDSLTAKGYRVFFSRITLEDKLGQEYEPYIFAALNSAKIMLAFGTNYDYYQAVWVKNEWSRYLKLMAKDKEKHLIPCYKDIDAYDIPKEFKHLQAQDMGKVGADQDLLRGIDKILRSDGAGGAGVVGSGQPIDINAAVSQAVSANIGSNVNALLERGFITLEDEDFEKADGIFEDVLNQEPKCASAYMGKLLAYYKMKSVVEFSKMIFTRMFLDKKITKTIEPEFDLDQFIQITRDNYLGESETTDNTLNIIYMSIQEEYVTCIDELKEFNSDNDYVETFCKLNDGDIKSSVDDNKLYSRYLQYATEVDNEKYDVNKVVGELVKNEYESEESRVNKIVDDYNNRFSVEVITSLIASANQKIKEKVKNDSNADFYTLENEFQTKLTQWKNNVKEINDNYEAECERTKTNWPEVREQRLKDWATECERLQNEYNDKYKKIVEDVQSYNGIFEANYNTKLKAYNTEITNIESQIEALMNRKSNLSIFKKKEKDEIDNNIDILVSKKSNMVKPELNLRPIPKKQEVKLPVKPEYSDTPIMPSKPELPAKP